MISLRTLVAFALVGVVAPANATLSYDDDVTPGVIFGTGNGNGFWTIDRNEAEGVELALRAKQRFPTPAGVYNSDGAGKYTFDAGAATSGAGWITAETPIWNFEFSVNSDYNGNGGNLDALTYEMTLDFDPSVVGVSGPSFDLLNPFTHLTHGGGMVDNSFGDNSTTAATDTVGNVFNFAGQVSSQNVAQNSQSYEFWNNSESFNPEALGEYTITLSAFDGASLVAETSIIVAAVPEPSAVLFGSLLTGLFGLTAARRGSRDDSDKG